MARKPHIIANQERDQRHQSYLAAPVLGEKYPGIQEVGVEMRFTDPEGRLTPSPQRRTYLGDMRAYFDFLCPLKDCEDGGFALNTAIQHSLSKQGHGRTGKLSCQGLRARGSEKRRSCELELEYKVVILERSRIAA